MFEVLKANDFVGIDLVKFQSECTFSAYASSRFCTVLKFSRQGLVLLRENSAFMDRIQLRLMRLKTIAASHQNSFISRHRESLALQETLRDSLLHKFMTLDLTPYVSITTLTTTPATSTFVSLPRAVLWMVFSQLSRTELSQCRLVSRLWRSMVSPLWCPNVLDCSNATGNIDEDKVAFVVAEAGDHLLVCNMSNCYEPTHPLARKMKPKSGVRPSFISSGDVNEMSSAVSVTYPTSHYTRKFDFSTRFSDIHASLIVQWCSNIQFLNLWDCRGLTQHGVNLIVEELSHLHELLLPISGSTMVHQCRFLSRLGIRRIKDDVNSLSFLKEILTVSGVHLKSLYLHKSSISIHYLDIIVNNGLFIQTLDFTGCCELSDAVLKKLATGLPNLRNLILASCCSITDAGMFELSLGSHHFTLMNLSNCVRITDASLMFISDALKSLKYLSLRQCHHVTANTVNFVAAHCPDLQFLDIFGCGDGHEIIQSTSCFPPSIHIITSFSSTLSAGLPVRK